MASVSGDALEFAYKYPFSEEARKLISSMDAKFDKKALSDGGIRVKRALEGTLSFEQIRLGSLMQTHLVSYVYARMVVSALRNLSALNAYVDAESGRAAGALKSAPEQELMRLCASFGMDLRKDGDGFSIAFEGYLSNMPRSEQFALSRQALKSGKVGLTSDSLIGLLRERIKKEIRKGLPIPVKELPPDVVSFSKTIPLPEPKRIPGMQREGGVRYRWIEKLIQHPIPDVRHRTVNLILAPYLTNVRGMAEDEAAGIIHEYIERCKLINPDTNVNMTYIRYQCHYAKSKGLKPLSQVRAKELLGEHVPFDE